jgi:hypothetical protein
MKRFTQPWKLCRNIGTQPAGNAACSPRPEVIITARVTPAPSPRWTFRDKGGATMPTCRPADLPTCRPADLPTCRPADLPTCRPAVWGVDDRWGDTACSLNACLGAGVPALFNSEVEDFAASSASTAKASLPKPDPLSNRIRRCSRSASFFTGKAQIPPGNSGEPQGFRIKLRKWSEPRLPEPQSCY